LIEYQKTAEVGKSDRWKQPTRREKLEAPPTRDMTQASKKIGDSRFVSEIRRIGQMAEDLRSRVSKASHGAEAGGSWDAA
jgi:hypothetical protein